MLLLQVHLRLQVLVTILVICIKITVIGGDVTIGADNPISLLVQA